MPEELNDRKVIDDRKSLEETASDFRNGDGSDEDAYYELMKIMQSATGEEKEAIRLSSTRETISQTNSDGQNINQSQRVDGDMVLGDTSDDFWEDTPSKPMETELKDEINDHNENNNSENVNTEAKGQKLSDIDANIKPEKTDQPEDYEGKLGQPHALNKPEYEESGEIIPGHIYDAQIIGEENGYYQVAIRTAGKPQILQVDFGVTAPMQNAIGSNGEVWAEIKILDQPKVIETKNLAWAGFTCKAEYIRDITQDKLSELGVGQAIVEKLGDNGSKSADTAATDATDPNVSERAVGHQDIESNNKINLWPYFNENAKWRVTNSTNDRIMVGVTDNQGSRLSNWTGHDIGEIFTLIEPLDPNNLENTNLVFEEEIGRRKISVALHDINQVLLPAADGVDDHELQSALDKIIEKAVGRRPEKAVEQGAGGPDREESEKEDKDDDNIAQHLLGASRNILARIAKGYNVNDKHPNQDYLNALNKPTTDSVAQAGLASDFRDVRGKLEVVASENQAADSDNRTEVAMNNQQDVDSGEPLEAQDTPVLNKIGGSSLGIRPKRGTMGVTNYSVPNRLNESTNDGEGEERSNLHEWVTYGPEGIIDDNVPQPGAVKGSGGADRRADHINFFKNEAIHDKGPAGDDIEADNRTLDDGAIKPTEIVTYDLGDSPNGGRNMGKDDYDRSAITVNTINGKYANDAMDSSNEEGDYHVVVSNPNADRNPLKEDEALALLQRRRAAAGKSLQEESMTPIGGKSSDSIEPVHFAAEMVPSGTENKGKITITNIEPAPGLQKQTTSTQPPNIQLGTPDTSLTESAGYKILPPHIGKQQNTAEAAVDIVEAQPPQQLAGTQEVHPVSETAPSDQEPSARNEVANNAEVGGTVDIIDNTADANPANAVNVDPITAAKSGNWFSRLLRRGTTGSNNSQTRLGRMKALSGTGEVSAEDLAKAHES